MINKLNTLIIILLFLFSCKNNSKIENNFKIFKYNESTGISSLDPINSSNKSNIWAVNHLFNGLVEFNENLEIKPSIAKEWNISPDALKYTFILRDDVYFHESIFFLTPNNAKKSRKVVAKDFVYSFNRLNNSPGDWVRKFILDDGIYAKDDTTLILHLKKPFPSFLSLLTMKYFSVVPQEVVENSDFSRHPIGTGPFKFKFWKDNVKMVLLRNNNYFEIINDDKLPYLDAINISFLKSEESIFINFVQGDLDLVSGLSPIFKEAFLNYDGQLNNRYKNKFKLYKTPYLNTEYLAINLNKCISINSPLKEKNMRDAINYSFDRKKIVKYLKNNIGYAANSGIVPTNLANYNVEGFDYKPDTIYDLLVDLNDNIDITLYTTSNYLSICEYLQSSFSNFGINLNIKVEPSSIFKQKSSEGEYCFFRASWIADYPDPENYFSLFYSDYKSPNGPNKTHFSNIEFDKLYTSSFYINEKKERDSLFKSMEELIINQSIIVPLYYDMAIRFVSNDVEGLSINSMNLLSLKKVKK